MESIIDTPLHDATRGDELRNSESFRYRFRWGLYGLANFIFFLLPVLGSAVFSRPGHNPFPYLVLLFALCSAPPLLIRDTNGRFSLLLIAGPILFLFYGFNDLMAYFVELPNYWQGPADALFTPAELGILLGIAFLFLGYLVGVKAPGSLGDRMLTDDWPVPWMVIVGLCCVALGFFATWIFQISSHGGRTSFTGGSLILTLQVFARMLEPVGVVLLSYGYLKTRGFVLLMMITGVIAVKLPLGILLNSKEIGISALAIFVMTKWIHDGRLPLRWMVIAVVIVTMYFPFSYAYRQTLGARELSVSSSLEKAGEYLGEAAEKKARSGGLAAGIQSVAGRLDLKTLMEIIVQKTEREVKFQKGHTLIELPLVFVPRLIWPEKPAVAVGQLFNREFRISANPDTYISTSFIGEMYWNFGWLGVALGMLTIGCAWGVIGRVANILEGKSIARMLILISAIYLLLLRFEAGIAQQFILFLRSSLIILVLHLIFSKRSVKE